MSAALLYPLAAPVLLLAALACWSRWARRGGALAWWTGVLALAAALDAVGVLRRRVEDDAGGPDPAAVTAVAALVAALLAARAWSRLGASRRGARVRDEA